MKTLKNLLGVVVIVFLVMATKGICFAQGMIYQEHDLTTPYIPRSGVNLSNGDNVFWGSDYTNDYTSTIFSTAGWSISVIDLAGNQIPLHLTEHNDTIYCAFTHEEEVTIGGTITYPDPPLGAKRPIAVMISSTGDILNSWEVNGSSYVWGIAAKSGEFALMGRAYSGAIQHLPPIGAWGGAYVLVNNLSGWDTNKGFSLVTEYIPDMHSIQYLANGNLALSGETAGGDISFGGIDLPVYGGGDGFRGEITTSGLGVHAIMIASLSYSAWEEDTYQITNSDGSFMVTGIYNFGISFYQSDGTLDTLLTTGNSIDQIYFAVYNSEGVFQNVTCAYNHFNEELRNVDLKCSGNAFYAIIMNSEGGTVNTPTGSHEEEAAVFLKFDASGNALWSKQYEGTPSSSNYPSFIIDGDIVAILGVEHPVADLDFNEGVVNLSQNDGYWCEYFDGPIPVISSQPMNITGCEGTTLSLEIIATGVESYQWYKNGNLVSGAIDPLLSFNPAQASQSGNYYCQITNLAGTVDSDIAIVTINTNPDPNILGDVTICEGESTILDAGAGYITFLWSTGASTQTISVSTADDYSVTVSNEFGCEGDDQVTVVVTPIPETPSTTANGPTVFCDTESVTISLDSPQSGITYHWSNGQTGNSITVYTTDDYSCYGQDGECTGENSNIISVTVNTTPDTPVITADDFELCEGETCTISVGSPQTGVTYYWSTGETGNSISTDDAGTYTCYGDNGDCQGESSNEIVVVVTIIPETPSTTANGSIVFCDTESVSISIDSPQAGITYHWTNGQTGNSITVNTTGDYSCYGQDGECMGEDSNVISVTVHPTPNTPVIVADDSELCAGDICTINISSPETGVTYYWSNGDTGNSISTDEAGTYTCYGDNGDCQGVNSNSIEVFVTVIPETPSVTANGPITFCDTEYVTLSVDSPQSGITYHWSNGQTGNDITVNTTGDFSCYAQDGECTGENSNTISVIVNPTPDIPVITADDTELCEGETTTISINNPQTGITYYWSTGETGNSISTNEAGTYTCYGDNTDCQSENSNSIEVEVQDWPVADFASDLQGGGTPLEIQFSDLSTGSPVSWLWDFGDGGTSTEQNPAYTYLNTGIYTVTLEVETSFGCIDAIIKEDYIDVVTGILEIGKSNAVNIYPNPSSGMFTISVKDETGIFNIEVANSIGLIVFKAEWHVNTKKFTTQIDISNHPPGVYNLKISGKKNHFLQKLIIK